MVVSCSFDGDDWPRCQMCGGVLVPESESCQICGGGSGTEPGLGIFRANMELIRERTNLILKRLWMEVPSASMKAADEISQARLRSRIREMVDADQAPLTMMEKGILLQNLLDEVFGFGPLGPVLRDPTVTGVFVNSPDSVFVERAGRMEKTSVYFDDVKHLKDVIERIYLPLGKSFGELNPILEATLPSGALVTATHPPVSHGGPTLTIRWAELRPLRFSDLVDGGSLSLNMARFLKACVRAGANIVVFGAHGHGKSTLLNTLAMVIPERERLISIEDRGELRLNRQGWVRLDPRSKDDSGPSVERKSRLVSLSVEMRADRVVMGDCIGGEVFEFLQLPSHGVQGNMTAVSAAGLDKCLSTLQMMAAMGAQSVSPQTMKQLIGERIDILVQVRRMVDGRFKVSGIWELCGLDGDAYFIRELFQLELKGKDGDGRLVCEYKGCGHSPAIVSRFLELGIDFDERWMN